MVQCKCKTDDGSKCKHPANPKSSHGYCTQHNKTKHAKMRCVSLARPTIGYKSPAKRPSSPRPLKKSGSKKSTKKPRVQKSAKKSKSRSKKSKSRSKKSAKKSAKKSRSKSRSKKSAKKSKSRSKKSAKKSKSRSKKSAKKSKSRSKKSAKKSKSRSKKSAKKSRSKKSAKKSKSRSKKSAKKSKSRSKKSKSRSKKSGKKAGKMRRYRMDGGASPAAAAVGPRIHVKVQNMAGRQDEYDFPAGATVKDLMRRAAHEKFLGDPTCFEKLRITDMNNMDAGILDCNTALVDAGEVGVGEYNIFQVTFEPGNLLRIYGPAQDQVRYFSPPGDSGNGQPIPFDC